MKKLTSAISKKIEDGIPLNRKEHAFVKNWDAGALFGLSFDWDCEKFIISHQEVEKALRAYLKKWPGHKKFKIKRMRISLNYTR